MVYLHYSNLSVGSTVLGKSKFTVSSQNSILNPWCFRQSSIEFPGSSFEDQVSSFESLEEFFKTLEQGFWGNNSHNAPSISLLYMYHCEQKLIFVSFSVNMCQPSSGICIAFSGIMRWLQYTNYFPAAPKWNK